MWKLVKSSENMHWDHCVVGVHDLTVYCLLITSIGIYNNLWDNWSQTKVSSKWISKNTYRTLTSALKNNGDLCSYRYTIGMKMQWFCLLLCSNEYSLCHLINSYDVCVMHWHIYLLQKVMHIGCRYDFNTFCDSNLIMWASLY